MTTNVNTNGIAPETVKTAVESALPGIFADQRWRMVGRYKFIGEVDGVRAAVVLATRSPGYDTYALNKGDFDRLLAGKRGGKVDAAYVVITEINALGARTYRGDMEAERLGEMLKGVPPRDGRFGAFYTLPPSILTDGVAYPDDWFGADL